MSARDDYQVLAVQSDTRLTSYPIDSAEAERALAEIDRLRVENASLRRAVTQQLDRKRRLVNQATHARKKRRELRDEIAVLQQENEGQRWELSDLHDALAAYEGLGPVLRSWRAARKAGGTAAYDRELEDAIDAWDGFVGLNGDDPLNFRRTRDAYQWVAFVQNVEVAELVDLIAIGRKMREIEAVEKPRPIGDCAVCGEPATKVSFDFVRGKTTLYCAEHGGDQ